jgi:flavin reductase (DIM6/NTAB) family NADH-FMN oxidoreductase RutF
METTPEIDPRHFRATMGRFATGVTVVTVGHGEHPHGMTANAFMSISLDPPLALVSVDQRARMNQHLSVGVRYGVNVLSEQQEAIGRHFAGRPVDGLRLEFVWHGDTPLIEGCVAHVVAQVIDVHPAGDHTLHIGRRVPELVGEAPPALLLRPVRATDHALHLRRLELVLFAMKLILSMYGAARLRTRSPPRGATASLGRP